MEKLTQLILDLMDRSAITPRQASLLMRYVGQPGYREGKLSILERLASNAISFDEAAELLGGLVGGEDLAEKELEEIAFWKRRHGIGMVFRFLMILALVAIFWTLHYTIPYLCKQLAIKTVGQNVEAYSLVAFVQAILIVVAAPGLGLLWLEALLLVICVPYDLLRNVFTSSKTQDKLIWLIAHIAGAVGSVGAITRLFAADRLLLQTAWLFLWLIALGIPPIAFFWVGHPKPPLKLAPPRSSSTPP
ncbi:MAG: hypothetical protein V2A58_17605 [Planctomycetota bacterium]